MAKTLKGAVLAQIGKGARSTLADVAKHGADGGVGGFTYYSDTCAFALRHRGLILERLRQDRDDLGLRSTLAVVEGFRVLSALAGTTGLDDALARYSAGEPEVDDDDVTLRNALAWYALECVAEEVANG